MFYNVHKTFECNGSILYNIRCLNKTKQLMGIFTPVLTPVANWSGYLGSFYPRQNELCKGKVGERNGNKLFNFPLPNALLLEIHFRLFLNFSCWLYIFSRNTKLLKLGSKDLISN